jgi:uncharacterized membrane protein
MPLSEQQPVTRGAPRERFKEGIKEYFLTGVLVLIPAVATLWVLKALLSFVDGFFAGLPARLQPQTYIPVPGVGVIVTLLLIVLVGAFARNYLGRITYHYGDRLMSNIPVLRGVYKALKQMLETVVSSPAQNFRKVVLVEYPRKGVYTIAFLTGAPRGEIQTITHKKVVYVFVPTTPNPTSGYLLIMSTDEVIPIDMTVEDAFKVIISGGMVNPGEGEELLNRHLPRPLPRRIKHEKKQAA